MKRKARDTTHLIHVGSYVSRVLKTIGANTEEISDSRSKRDLPVTVEVVEVILNDEYHGGRKTEI